MAGDAEQATALLKEALVRSRETNIPHTVATSLRNLGLIARWQGQFARAEALFQEAAAQDLPPGWYRGYSMARSLSCLARVACLQHDFTRARGLLQQAFGMIRSERVTGQALADCLDWQAALEAMQGDRPRCPPVRRGRQPLADERRASLWARRGGVRADLAGVRAAFDEQAFADGSGPRARRCRRRRPSRTRYRRLTRAVCDNNEGLIETGVDRALEFAYNSTAGASTKGQDLRHDHARDAPRGIDPVVGIGQAAHATLPGLRPAGVVSVVIMKPSPQRIGMPGYGS